jgi:hypothetical protein
VAVSNSDEPCEVYENLTPTGARWLQVDLATAAGNRHGIGARLELTSAGRRGQVREVRTASSYMSQNALTAHFGLGTEEPVRLEVRWPDGGRTAFVRAPPGRRLTIVR